MEKMESVDARNAARLRKLQKAANGKIAKEAFERESRIYFETIKEPPVLFIEVKKISSPHVYLDIRNLIVLLIYKTFQLEKWIQLRIVLKRTPPSSSKAEQHAADLDSAKASTDDSLTLRLNISLEPGLIIENDEENETNSSTEDSIDEIILGTHKKHPSIAVTCKKLTICGISSVLRFMLKFVCLMIENNLSGSKNNDDDQYLYEKLKQFLGFRQGCLQACAESSMWTKFCEVDMIDAVNQINGNEDFNGVTDASVELTITEHLVRFERHLSLPVRIHNYRKVVQDIKKAGGVDNLSNDLQQNLLISDLKHEFAEGPILLLSDLILYPSVHSYVLYYGEVVFERYLPISFEWYEKLRKFYSSSSKASFTPDFSLGREYGLDKIKSINWNIPDVPVQTLYSTDPKRNQSTLRQFTRQHEIDEALEFLINKNIVPLEIEKQDPNFKWDDIPLLAHPEGGNLPVSRRNRKCDQLASMAFYALQAYSATKSKLKSNSKNRFRIVDFCSGGGHVGILLATLLPECDIVLVENKDESLRRAQERVNGLKLSNVFFYQSNLDYFENDFDLGLALHACGTATDLVLGKCVASNASFVCSPCCYGAVHENHILTYPRSSVFQESGIPLRLYLVLCHASDHTHEEAHEKTSQGNDCMALIDTDRCRYAADHAYRVKLCKMVPETASPKNHILVGIAPSKTIVNCE